MKISTHPIHLSPADYRLVVITSPVYRFRPDRAFAPKDDDDGKRTYVVVSDRHGGDSQQWDLVNSGF